MNPDQFDSELKTYYRKIKSEIKQQHQDYIKKHPELREILNDFLSQVLLEKPTDVYDYSTDYFSYFNIDKDKIKFRPLIICGPSGSGKSTLIKRLVEAFPDIFETSIGYTTRAPLISETHGVQYYFVSKNEFEKEITKGQFIEYSQRENGDLFGTHSGKLNAIINSGKVCLLELDIKGAQEIQRRNSDWKFVFIRPESLKVCEERLIQKNSYTEQQIQERMVMAQTELEQRQQCNFFSDIKNTDLEASYQQLHSYIQSNYSEIQI